MTYDDDKDQVNEDAEDVLTIVKEIRERLRSTVLFPNIFDRAQLTNADRAQLRLTSWIEHPNITYDPTNPLRVTYRVIDQNTFEIVFQMWGQVQSLPFRFELF